MATTDVRTWKGSRMVDLTLPSGNVCKARRVGLDAMIKGGRIPNNLLPMMKGALAGQSVDAAKLKESVTPETVQEMMGLFDVIAMDVMVEPKCHPVPELGERDDETLYVDDLDMEDKQFLFQWATGGTSDVEKFRDETSQLVAALQPSERVGSSAKSPARRK